MKASLGTGLGVVMKSGGNQETEKGKRMNTAFERGKKIWEKRTKTEKNLKKSSIMLTGSPKLSSNLPPPSFILLI